MTTDVTRVLMQILPKFKEDVESYAECCSRGASGKLEDMDTEDADIVYENRFLIRTAEKALQAEGVTFEDGISSHR